MPVHLVRAALSVKGIGVGYLDINSDASFRVDRFT